MTKDLSNLASMLTPFMRTSLTLPNSDAYHLDLSSVDRQEIADRPIEAYLVALGSNFQADKHLAVARAQLEESAHSHKWSSSLINPDYTANEYNPKPDYTNQCGLLTLEASIPFCILHEDSKRIEQHCKRDVKPKLLINVANNADSTRTVSIDIDILAVCISGAWKVIKQRYPFKEHEMIGVRELIE